MLCFQCLQIDEKLVSYNNDYRRTKDEGTTSSARIIQVNTFW